MGDDAATFCTISAEIEIQGCGTAGGGEDELCGASPDSSAMTRTPRRRQVCDLLPPSIADDMLRFSAEAGGQLPAAAAIERWASACGLFLVYVHACACVPRS